MTQGEFRRIPPDRLDEYRSIVDYAFTPENGPGEPDDSEDLADQPGERFGVFVDGELRSVCKHYDFETRLRGDWHPLAGLAAVATPPEHRRQGYVSQAIGASLDRWRGAYPLAALWPFDRAFYRQFGWATASTTVEYTCPPDALAFAREAAADADAPIGRFRPVDAADWAALHTDCYSDLPVRPHESVRSIRNRPIAVRIRLSTRPTPPNGRCRSGATRRGGARKSSGPRTRTDRTPTAGNGTANSGATWSTTSTRLATG